MHVETSLFNAGSKQVTALRVVNTHIHTRRRSNNFRSTERLLKIFILLFTEAAEEQVKHLERPPINFFGVSHGVKSLKLRAKITGRHFSNQKASRDWCNPSSSRAFAPQSKQRERNVVRKKAAVVCVGRRVA